MTVPATPALAAERCRELDRLAGAVYGIPSLLLMEHAAIGTALLAERVLARPLTGACIWVICGPGNNGGDGYATARQLANGGAIPIIWSLAPRGAPSAASDPSVNLEIARRMGLEVLTPDEDLPPPPAGIDLVIDALFGTGLARVPTGRFAAAIRLVEEVARPTLAVDVPSGLDADRGVPWGIAVTADWTATYGVPKQGFSAPGARRFTGEVFYVPIGIPRALLPAGIEGFPPAPHPLRRAD